MEFKQNANISSEISKFRAKSQRFSAKYQRQFDFLRKGRVFCGIRKPIGNYPEYQKSHQYKDGNAPQSGSGLGSGSTSYEWQSSQSKAVSATPESQFLDAGIFKSYIDIVRNNR